MKPTILIICPPDQPVLRMLEPLQASSEILVSNDQAQLLKLAPQAEVIVVTGISSEAVNLPEVWKRATSLRWIHSLTTGVEKLLFTELVDSPIPLSNARGVFKRS